MLFHELNATHLMQLLFILVECIPVFRISDFPLCRFYTSIKCLCPGQLLFLTQSIDEIRLLLSVLVL